ncbi:MAG: hypothetical protein ACLP7Q_23790 [Isosphaeraceae bacterium]
MSRIRVALVMAGMVVAWAALAIKSQAQPPPGWPGDPGGPAGRDDRGQGIGPNEPAPFNGPEGPGGFASDLFRLANNETVQKELKLTDRQKAAIKRVSDDQAKKRSDFFQGFRTQSDAARTQAVWEAQAQALAGTQVDPSVDARGWGAGNPLYGALNSRGYQPRIYGGQPEMDPTACEQQAKLQGQMAGDVVQNQSRQMMGEAMQEFQQESESALARVLDKAQSKRLREIQLQVEGAGAVLRADVSEKLGIRDDQRAEIEDIVNHSNAARSELMRKNRDFVRSMMPTPATDPNQAADGQPDDPLVGPNDPSGRGGRRHVDPEAMRSALEQPEVKAKMDESLKEHHRIRDRQYTMVYKAMDRRQLATFKKMLGKPFDVDSLLASSFRGGSGGRRTGQNPATDQPKAQAKPGSTTPAAATKPTDSSATPASRPAAPRRPSLRERRGLGGPQPSADATPN